MRKPFKILLSAMRCIIIDLADDNDLSNLRKMAKEHQIELTMAY